MSFDEKVFLIAKWLVYIIVFVGIVMPFNVIWFFIVPLIKMFQKKTDDGGLETVEINAFTPIELYMKFGKRFLGLDE